MAGQLPLPFSAEATLNLLCCPQPSPPSAPHSSSYFGVKTEGIRRHPSASRQTYDLPVSTLCPGPALQLPRCGCPSLRRPHSGDHRWTALPPSHLFSPLPPALQQRTSHPIKPPLNPMLCSSYHRVSLPSNGHIFTRRRPHWPAPSPHLPLTLQPTANLASAPTTLHNNLPLQGYCQLPLCDTHWTLLRASGFLFPAHSPTGT